MNLRYNLHYFHDVYTALNGTQRREENVYSSCYKDLLNAAKRNDVHIRGSIGSSFWSYENLFPKKQHIMILNANDPACLKLMTQWLVMVAKINYGLIESSAGRYWIVTDFVGSWEKICRLLRIIPGIEANWYRRICKHGQITVRALPHPINGSLPRFDQIIPNKRLANPDVVEWTEKLMQHFDRKEITDIAKNWQANPRLDSVTVR